MVTVSLGVCRCLKPCSPKEVAFYKYGMQTFAGERTMCKQCIKRRGETWVTKAMNITNTML